MLKFLPLKNQNNPNHKLSVSRNSVLISVFILCQENNVCKQKRKGEFLSNIKSCCLICIIIIYDLSREAKTLSVCGCFTLEQHSKSWEMNITNFHGDYLPAHSMFSVLQNTKVLHNKAGEKEVWLECLCWQNCSRAAANQCHLDLFLSSNLKNHKDWIFLFTVKILK